MATCLGIMVAIVIFVIWPLTAGYSVYLMQKEQREKEERKEQRRRKRAAASSRKAK